MLARPSLRVDEDPDSSFVIDMKQEVDIFGYGHRLASPSCLSAQKYAEQQLFMQVATEAISCIDDRQHQSFLGHSASIADYTRRGITVFPLLVDHLDENVMRGESELLSHGWSDTVKLRHFGVRVSRSPIKLRGDTLIGRTIAQRVEFNPSPALTQFVSAFSEFDGHEHGASEAEPVLERLAQTTDQDFESVKREFVRKSVLRYLQALADVNKSTTKPVTVSLVKGSKFEGPIEKGLLFRVQIRSAYDQVGYLNQLFSELKIAANAGQMGRNNWQLLSTDPASLVLFIEKDSKAVREPTRKAAVHFRFTKS